MRRLAVLLLCALPLAGLAGVAASRYVGLPGGTFRSALKYPNPPTQ